LGSGVWWASSAGCSVSVVDFSITGTSLIQGVGWLDTSSFAGIWNITIAASEATSIFLNDIHFIGTSAQASQAV
jgi:hypothetical protein